jgi:hypothetical protein
MIMDTRQQARALMIRHHKTIANRQQSLLGRAAGEIGMDVTGTDYYNTLKVTAGSGFVSYYDRSNSTIS